MALHVSNFFTGLGGFSPSFDTDASLAGAADDFADGIRGLSKRRRDRKRRDEYMASYAGMDEEMASLEEQKAALEEMLYNIEHGGNG